MSNITGGAVPSIVQASVTQPLLPLEQARQSSPKLKRQLLPLSATNSFSKNTTTGDATHQVRDVIDQDELLQQIQEQQQNPSIQCLVSLLSYNIDREIIAKIVELYSITHSQNPTERPSRWNPNPTIPRDSETGQERPMAPDQLLILCCKREETSIHLVHS